jgi:hypothetical protein
MLSSLPVNERVHTQFEGATRAPRFSDHHERTRGYNSYASTFSGTKGVSGWQWAVPDHPHRGSTPQLFGRVEGCYAAPASRRRTGLSWAVRRVKIVRLRFPEGRCPPQAPPWPKSERYSVSSAVACTPDARRSITTRTDSQVDDPRIFGRFRVLSMDTKAPGDPAAVRVGRAPTASPAGSPPHSCVKQVVRP